MKKINIILFIVVILIMSSCGNNKPADSNKDSSAATIATADSSANTAQTKKTVLFFGNSLTAGYGLEDAATQGFPALIQNKIDSLNLPYKTVNAGNSGETSAGGKGRIGWILKQKVDVFVLELGANDGLRGIPVKETVANLQAIIDTVKLKYPAAKLVLLGMQVPPNMGSTYGTEFKNVYPQLAAKNNMALVPFLLQGVGGVASLNQADGIHPTAEGDKIVADNIWKVLKGVL